MALWQLHQSHREKRSRERSVAWKAVHGEMQCPRCFMFFFFLLLCLFCVFSSLWGLCSRPPLRLHYFWTWPITKFSAHTLLLSFPHSLEPSVSLMLKVILKRSDTIMWTHRRADNVSCNCYTKSTVLYHIYLVQYCLKWAWMNNEIKIFTSF